MFTCIHVSGAGLTSAASRGGNIFFSASLTLKPVSTKTQVDVVAIDHAQKIK